MRTSSPVHPMLRSGASGRGAGSVVSQGREGTRRESGREEKGDHGSHYVDRFIIHQRRSNSHRLQPEPCSSWRPGLSPPAKFVSCVSSIKKSHTAEAAADAAAVRSCSRGVVTGKGSSAPEANHRGCCCGLIVVEKSMNIGKPESKGEGVSIVVIIAQAAPSSPAVARPAIISSMPSTTVTTKTGTIIRIYPAGDKGAAE